MNRKPSIMIVDDEAIVRDSLAVWLEEDGYEIRPIESGKKALEEIVKREWNLLLVDLKMPEMDGLQFMAEVKKILPDIPIIIMTAYATVETAVQAIKKGAYDYLIKPFDPEGISITIKKILKQQELEQENIYLKKELENQFPFQEIISKNKKMHDISELIKTFAKTNKTILISGESGTGKGLIAASIHTESLRKNGPFVKISCATLTDELLKNELFGHERSFLPEYTNTVKGKLELANGGTLLLDEIGEMSLELQIELLRIIETKEFTRLGGKIPIRTDIRIISTTNKDLIKVIAEGKFRNDFYYRLSDIIIELPPLKERLDDIPLLVQQMIEKISMETHKKVNQITTGAMAVLMHYHWPGNIRELKNVIERAVMLAENDLITEKEIDSCIKMESQKIDITEDVSLASVEKKHIYKILLSNDWDIKKSANMLGIEIAILTKKIKDYELQKG